MTDDTELSQILRHAAGDSTAEEARRVEAALERDPALKAEADAWLAIRAAAPPPPWDTERALDLLQREMRPATRVVRFPQPAAPRWKRFATYAAAAAVLLAIGAGVLWRTMGDRSNAAKPVAVAMRDYVTPRGQRADFKLPDGTHVLLSVASRLRVPADYGVRDRRVYLEGEAYFDVQHDAASRFFVHTGRTVTEDLGTKFDVRAYRSDSTVRVVVEQGRVVVRVDDSTGTNTSRQATLAAGQLAHATADGEIRTATERDVAQYLAWTEGTLIFKNATLTDALPELGRWFDLDFQLGDAALARRELTASFRQQPNDQLLTALSLALDVRAERSGRVVTFRARRGTAN